MFFDVRMTRLWDGTQISRIHHHTVGITMRYRVSAVFCCVWACELRDGLRQERASITDFHGLINQRVHIVLEQRAASAKAEQYWSGVKIVAGIAGVGGLAVAGIASVARLG